MRAIVKRSAQPDDIALTTVPVPDVNDCQLLVRIRAIGVGIHDGYYLPETIDYPYPIGIEAAGTIEKIGVKVTNYQVGEPIAFVSAMQPKGGTWAEFAVVEDASLIVRIPPGVTFEQAATVPVAGNTVLKAFHALDLKPNDTLFVAGASGAIGTFAIQLAVARGCIVAGSASRANHAYMLSLGAAKTVDYHDANWVEEILKWRPGGVDAALAIQPGTAAQSMPAVRDAGCVVVVSGDDIKSERGIRTEHIPHHIKIQQELAQMLEQISWGEIKVEIQQTLPFENGLEALQKTQTRHARGKLVIALP